MTRLLEDFLTQTELAAIEELLDTREVRFDKLVKMAGLDPNEDLKFSDLRAVNFCGADLRGFNFEGCDLRNAIRNSATQVDDTTTLTDAKIRWIEEGDIAIVEKMQQVQVASDREQRLLRLRELQQQFGRTDHVLAFIVNAATDATSFDAYMDYIEFLPGELSQQMTMRLVHSGEKLLQKKVAQARQRTRRSKTAIFAVAPIYERLRESENSFAFEWYKKIADLSQDDSTTSGRSTLVSDAEPDLLVEALIALVR